MKITILAFVSISLFSVCAHAESALRSSSEDTAWCCGVRDNYGQEDGYCSNTKDQARNRVQGDCIEKTVGTGESERICAEVLQKRLWCAQVKTNRAVSR